jgi:hypothetical protein
VPNKPKKTEYVLACTALSASSTSSTSSTVDQILELLDAKAAFAPQGRMTITLENHDDSGTSGGGSTGS